MFDNIGGKMKAFAKILCILGIIGASIGFIVMLIGGIEAEEAVVIIMSFVVLGVGILFAWIGSWGLYGFGELIENSDKQTYLLNSIEKKIDRIENR